MKVHLVDGTFELFRAYYGAPSAKSPTGREVGATRSLARSLLRLVDEGATHIAIAFDHVIESFRNDLFDGYKTGAGIEPDLLEQFELAEEIASALGFVVWPMVEFEADDAIATFVDRALADDRVEEVRICSPDKDLAQCVRDRVVMVDRIRKTELDADGVLEKFGVRPGSIPDWLALVGDAADGIPGIPKWGKKSAATLLLAYDSIERIPDDETTWSVKVRGAAGLAETLRRSRDKLSLFKTLATLRRDVPLTELVNDLAFKGADTQRIRGLASELGDDSLLERAAATAS